MSLPVKEVKEAAGHGPAPHNLAQCRIAADVQLGDDGIQLGQRQIVVCTYAVHDDGFAERPLYLLHSQRLDYSK